MKNLVFCICLLISFTNFGQGYLPIFEGYDSVRWNNVFSWHAISAPISGAYTSIAEISDSLVVSVGKEYRFYQYIEDNSILNGEGILVREDTIEKKIFAKTESDPEEILIYDFSVEVGDEFLLGALINGYLDPISCSAKVISVETMFIYGKNRKIISLEVHGNFDLWTCPYNPIWVEGIGTHKAFDYFNSWYHWADQASVKTHCIFKNGEQVFMEGDCLVDTIIDLTSIENIHLENKVNISPNPTNNQLTIKNTSSSFFFGKIKITNLSGQLLFEKEVNFQENVRIEEVEKLKAGVYFISLETEAGRAMKKFIKL